MKRLLIYAGVIVALVVGAYLLIYGLPGSSPVNYTFATVTRGDVETTVSATGTLSPVTTIEVGTQVSGTIDSIFVDFNDTVKAGQILVVLDTLLLKASVVDAEASVEKADAQVAQAQADYDRNKALFEKKLISESEWLPFAINLKSQQATRKSAEASLDRARRNLDYAVIRSPIDGIVIGRSVEAGQTVAASLSTPTLFTIAQDLASMEILADVDESDIGEIKVGQDVRFEVASYIDKEFTGTVTQIRLQPQTISNVVTYTVVVEAPNTDNLLLPGMTATVDFITERRTDVLMVPSKALRFRPTEDQLAAVRERQQATRPESTDSTRATSARRAFAGARSAQPPENAGMVWFLDSLGRIAPAPVQTGMTDGSNIEIVRSPVLTEGMQIIAGESTDEESSSATTTTQQRRPMGGPPGMRPF